MKVHILVHGDLAVSPRIRNHAISFCKESVETHLSGYKSHDLPRELQELPNLTIHDISSFPCSLDSSLPVAKLSKFVWLFIVTLFHLMRVRNVDWILTQSPPSVPMLLAVYVYSSLVNLFFRRGNNTPLRLAVDWHNYGYSILHKQSLSRLSGQSSMQSKVSVGEQSVSLASHGFTTRIHKYLEVDFARRFLSNSDRNLHFCVSQAFRHDLTVNGIGPCSVLYDRPVRCFTSSGLKAAQEGLFQKLWKGCCFERSRVHFLQYFTDYEPRLAPHRKPFLLVSSCSWTLDDDFGLFFSALDFYAKAMEENEDDSSAMPPILCIITGKGPLKAYWLEQLREREHAWNNKVQVFTPWLEADDYPLLLSSCDLGICMHHSTSGLDLPMKVVDLFAAEVPVIAYQYNCIGELVQDQVNGRLYSTDEQLFGLLVDIIREHSKICEIDGGSGCRCRLHDYRRNIRSWKTSDWHMTWKRVVLSQMQQ